MCGEDKRNGVIKEIVFTEINYFNGLKKMGDLFTESLASGDPTMLSPQEMEELLFEKNNWNELMDCSRRLLE